MSVCRRRVSRGCAARLAVRVIRANPGKSAALASELRADGEEANRRRPAPATLSPARGAPA